MDDNTGMDAPDPMVQQGQADGSPPPEADSGVDAADDQTVELRRELTEKGEALRDYKTFVSFLEQNPDLSLRQALAKMQGQEPEPDPNEQIEALLGKFEGEEMQKTLRDLLTLNRKAVERDVERRLGPTLQQTEKFRRETQWERDLRTHGVDPMAAETQAVEKELQGEKWYRLVKQDDATEAARVLAREVTRRKETASGIQNSQKRLQDAKRGSLEAGGRGGVPPTDRQEIDFKPGQSIMDLFTQIRSKK